MRGSTRFAAAVSVALVAALALPVGAIAVDSPGSGGVRDKAAAGSDRALVAQAGSNSPNADARKQQLQDRVTSALQNRAQRFERTQERLRERLERVEQMCDTVDGAGGDTVQIRQRLEEAEAALDAAEATEALAAEQFGAISEADDRRAAFAQARQTGKQAVGHLQGAREQLNTGARELRDVIETILEDTGA